MADTDSKSMSWSAFFTLIALVLVTLYATYMTGLHSGANGGRLAIQVGKTEILDRQAPDLTSELKTALEEVTKLKVEKTALEESHRASIADVQSRLVTKSNELDDALAALSSARLNDNTRMVEAAQRQRDRANEARDNALAEVADIKSSMANLAMVCSTTVAQLRLEHTATVAALESRLNQVKARELAAKDEIIAQLQRVVQSQRLDVQNLQFAAQGSTVPANGLVNVEILAPAVPLRNRFSVRFEQRRELNFDVEVVNRNLETQTTVQVPPGLYTVTRLVDGRPFGSPVDTLIWPGSHRSWFQFGNNSVWHTVERSNPFIAFWNGVGERRSTLPNGSIRLVNGDMVTVENGRVVRNDTNK